MENIKDKVRPLYGELLGYLNKAPEISKRTIVTSEVYTAGQNLIEEIGQVTGISVDRFRLMPAGKAYINSMDAFNDRYQQALAGLISRLHAQFFSDEIYPLDAQPGMVIYQTQNQTQTSIQQVMADFSRQLDEKIKEHQDDPEKKGFLEKVKTFAGTAGSIADLLSKVHGLAIQYGLSLNDLSSIFGG
jgi:hypothetical protein